jgi:hypothetical protein
MSCFGVFLWRYDRRVDRLPIIDRESQNALNMIKMKLSCTIRSSYIIRDKTMNDLRPQQTFILHVPNIPHIGGNQS